MIPSGLVLGGGDPTSAGEATALGAATFATNAALDPGRRPQRGSL